MPNPPLRALAHDVQEVRELTALVAQAASHLAREHPAPGSEQREHETALVSSFTEALRDAVDRLPPDHSAARAAEDVAGAAGLVMQAMEHPGSGPDLSALERSLEPHLHPSTEHPSTEHPSTEHPASGVAPEWTGPETFHGTTAEHPEAIRSALTEAAHVVSNHAAAAAEVEQANRDVATFAMRVQNTHDARELASMGDPQDRLDDAVRRDTLSREGVDTAFGRLDQLVAGLPPGDPLRLEAERLHQLENAVMTGARELIPQGFELAQHEAAGAREPLTDEQALRIVGEAQVTVELEQQLWSIAQQAAGIADQLRTSPAVTPSAESADARGSWGTAAEEGPATAVWGVSTPADSFGPALPPAIDPDF